MQAQVQELIERHHIEALAVCLLHSYANDEHEQRIAECLRDAFPDLYLSLSSEVLAFMREYERWTTTTLNAYTQPHADRYLARIESRLRGIGFGDRC